MKNWIRCCISCILPCGAFDVIRIVHANGRVEVISDGPVRAQEIMKLHPKHVLKKPLSSYEQEGRHKTAGIVSPEVELKRGKIYFLIPRPLMEKPGPRPEVKRKVKEVSGSCNNCYSSEIVSESVTTQQRDRRRGHSGVWRPHLDSISETPVEI